jgi:tetratricopeptide (TPR) repeat protein
MLTALMALRHAAVAMAAVVLLGAAPQNPLVRARQLYNQQQYDAAIAAAREARARPDLADAAAVVLGRAHLERYRTASDTADLNAARESLLAVDTVRLIARDRLELLIGLGELLYFEGHFGAAAELFGAALGSAAPADGTSREAVLDWWAMALDHEAQDSGDAERRLLYTRMLRLVEPASAGDRPSAAAMYWVAAAAAGMDDFGRAWHAAIAAWVRAPLAYGPGSALRTDLERLVQQVIIPGRAVTLPPAADRKQAIADMQAEWNAIKELGPRR